MVRNTKKPCRSDSSALSSHVEFNRMMGSGKGREKRGEEFKLYLIVPQIRIPKHRIILFHLENPQHNKQKMDTKCLCTRTCLEKKKETF